ncbi:MAG TPA: Nramp family divalent metal transporter [Acidimicrobiales bacterium]|nr:Nramp family divalent metal transporter [Acidimicrobiales bacterium]
MAIHPKRKARSRREGPEPALASTHRSEFDLTPEYEGPIWRQYLRAMGPGLVTGASDDDPSGIATYSQAGAKFGLAFVWTALLTFPLMAAVQEICDRTALATGTGLGELAVQRFHRTGRAVLGVLLIVLIVANALNIAADLVAIGAGMNLLNAGPTWLWALLAGAIITVLLVIGSFARIALVFKVLCAPLLAYIVVAILVTHQWGQVLTHTLVPHLQFNKTYLALLVAVLGTTISPYLFFWQSAHRIEEMRDAPEGGAMPLPLKRLGRRRAGRKERMSRLDVFTGMAFSNIVMFAIIVATAQTLHAHHVTNIQSAAQAAKALRPFAGRFASAIFAFGFIGSGLLAIPVLAASGSVGLAGLLGKEWGFSRSIRQAPVFYGLLALGTVGGTAFSLLHVNPIKLLVLVAVINGVAAAPFLFVVMRVSSSQHLMGRSVNGPTANILGWLTAVIMAAAAIAFFATGGL